MESGQHPHEQYNVTSVARNEKLSTEIRKTGKIDVKSL